MAVRELHCRNCTTRYAVDLTACPRCGNDAERFGQPVNELPEPAEVQPGSNAGSKAKPRASRSRGKPA